MMIKSTITTIIALTSLLFLAVTIALVAPVLFISDTACAEGDSLMLSVDTIEAMPEPAFTFTVSNLDDPYSVSYSGGTSRTKYAGKIYARALDVENAEIVEITTCSGSYIEEFDYLADNAFEIWGRKLCEKVYGENTVCNGRIEFWAKEIACATGAGASPGRSDYNCCCGSSCGNDGRESNHIIITIDNGSVFQGLPQTDLLMLESSPFEGTPESALTFTVKNLADSYSRSDYAGTTHVKYAGKIYARALDVDDAEIVEITTCSGSYIEKFDYLADNAFEIWGRKLCEKVYGETSPCNGRIEFWAKEIACANGPGATPGRSGYSCCCGSSCGYDGRESNHIIITINDGNISLALSPNPSAPSAFITADITGLFDCDGKIVRIKENSCSGAEECTCFSSGAGCSCEFTASAVAGDYTYYACIDKNNDNDYSDSGESDSEILKVEIDCAFETESCLSMSCCSSPPAPESLTCVDYICRSCISKNCSADDAKDNGISEMGDAIDDIYCTWNIHDGCLVKSSIETVGGCNGIPSYWEYESCDVEPGTSDLWGEKKVRIDDINNYNIKTRCGVDDYSSVWINNIDIDIPNVCCDYGDWFDATNYFVTGWNTIKFKAVDTCGDDAWGDCGGRWFDLEWEIVPSVSVLDGSPVSFSEISLSWSDRGEGITYSVWNFDTGEFVYNGDQTSFNHKGLDSDEIYSYKVIATKNDYDSDWSNTISVTTFTFVGIENCCNTIDDDGDGDENGKDSDCQNDVGLAAGDNTICWWTEWDNYSADADYYSGWYSCPDGYIVDNVNIDQYTEEGCDFFYIYDSDMSPRYKDGGMDGNKDVDLIPYNTQKVKFRFRSDTTAEENGVIANTITCSLPISFNVAPVALLNCNPAICSGYIKDGFSFDNDSTDADSTNFPDMNNDIVKSKWYVNGILNATYPNGGHSTMDSFFPSLAVGSHEIKLKVEDTGGFFGADTKIFRVKRDAKVDFLCSIDQIDWQNCASFTPTILEYDYVYFKDNSTVSQDASKVLSWKWDRFVPEEGWKTFYDSAPIARLEFTGVTFIRLTIVDDAGRSDAQKYRVPVIIYEIEYEEVAP